MWIEFTGDMGMYKRGWRRNLPKPLAERAIRIGRAKRIDSPTEPETAMVDPPENAARRTSRPSPRYVGYGWWQVGERKVRGPKDATPEQILEHA